MNNVLFIAFNQSQISQYSNLNRLLNDYNFDLFQVNETNDNSTEVKSEVKKAIFTPIRLGVNILSNVLVFVILLNLLLLQYSSRVFGHRVIKRFTIVRNDILYFFYKLSYRSTFKGPLLKGTGRLFEWIGASSIFFKSSIHLRAKQLNLQETLGSNSYKYVIISEENVLDSCHLFVSIVQDHQIPVICIPYTFGIREEWANAYSNTSNNGWKSIDLFFSRSFFPNLVLNTDSTGTSTMPLFSTIYAGRNNISREILWSGHLGLSDHTLIDSDEGWLEYSKLFSASKKLTRILPVQLTLACDLSQKSVPGELSPSVMNIGIFLPPDQGVSRVVVSGLSTTGDYRELVEKLIETLDFLVPRHARFIVFPHPRNPSIDIPHLQRSLEVSQDWPSKLFSLDFAIIFASALFRFLLQAHIPVINWDVYKYDYKETFPADNSSFFTISSPNEIFGIIEQYEFSYKKEALLPNTFHLSSVVDFFCSLDEQ